MTNAVSQQWRDAIRARLAQIAKEENILILLAIESGSRAWGFHSTDSDYDVRFIYARPVDWHLELGRKRDVVERPIDDKLDLSGWALDKTLQLAMKGNAVIAEWLQSPIIYEEHPGARETLLGFCDQVLQRRPLTWHYRSLAHRQMTGLHNPDGSVRLKRFFYTLRPALALRWMRLNTRVVPPMHMTALRQGCTLDPAIEAAIDELTARKAQQTEKDSSSMEYSTLFQLIKDELDHADTWLASDHDPKPANTTVDAANAIHKRFSRVAGT